jgi:hypothetical protein
LQTLAAHCGVVCLLALPVSFATAQAVQGAMEHHPRLAKAIRESRAAIEQLRQGHGLSRPRRSPFISNKKAAPEGRRG